MPESEPPPPMRFPLADDACPIRIAREAPREDCVACAAAMDGCADPGACVAALTSPACAEGEGIDAPRSWGDACEPAIIERLASFGPAAAPQLLDGYDATYPARRGWILEALRRWGPSALPGWAGSGHPQALPALLALDDASAELAQAPIDERVALVLAQRRWLAEHSIELLDRTLRDPEYAPFDMPRAMEAVADAHPELLAAAVARELPCAARRSGLPWLVDELRSRPGPHSAAVLTGLLFWPSWRAQLQAIRALAEGDARGALAELDALAITHWSARVREDAAAAATWLRRPIGSDAMGPAWSSSGAHTDEHQVAGCPVAPEQRIAYTSEYPPPPRPLLQQLERRALQVPHGLRFLVPYDAHTALELEHGWLLGFHGFEHSGALLWLDRDGTPTWLGDRGVFGIVGTANAILVVQDDGIVLAAVGEPPTLRFVAELPAKPLGLRVDHERTLVATDAGVMAIAQDGSITVLPCE